MYGITKYTLWGSVSLLATYTSLLSKGNALSIFVFGRCSIQVSVSTPAISLNISMVFPSSLKLFRDSTWIRLRQLPSKSFQTRHSSVALPSYTMECSYVMTAWLRNPQKTNVGHHLPLSGWVYFPQYKGNTFKMDASQIYRNTYYSIKGSLVNVSL
jgi:hypothetical protein